MKLPVRPIKQRCPAWLQRRLAPRLLWPDPVVLVDEEPDPADYRRIMSGLYVGGTIKITEADRHPEADQLLIDNVNTESAFIVDIGASDGTTSLDLIRRLNGFRKFTIADLHLQVALVRLPRSVAVFDDSNLCILVATRHLIAWPTQSKLIALIFAPVVGSARRHRDHAEIVTLLNPSVKNVIARDPRIKARTHDVFTVWPDPKPDVIKVANLLRRLYFSDEQLLAGLRAVTSSLPSGGHLLLVDNPRTADPTPRAALYRRDGKTLHLVAQTLRDPELANLIPQIAV